jgi:Tol biopolymer transport system component/DNA-binding winged helix-turn-helix (wHTH) protein
VAAALVRRLQHFDQHSSIFLNMVKSEDLQVAYEFGPFRLEKVRRRLLCRGEGIQLRPKAVETLLLLIEQRDRVVEKEELLACLWPNTVVEEANLTQYIYLLRKTLSEHNGEQEYILTVPGRGYRFVESVTEVQGERTGLALPEYNQAQVAFEEKAAAAPRHAEPASAQAPTDSQEGQPQTTEPLLISHAAAARPRLKSAGVAAIIAILFLTGALAIYLIRGTTDSTAAAAWSLARLTNTGNAPLASISPDGKLVTYVVAEGGQQSLWIRSVATTDEMQIVPPAEVYYGGMTFLPDGHHIYYVVRGKGESAYSLYQLPVIGGVARKVKTGLDSPISFSPDGTWFAFVRELAESGKSSLLLAATDGSLERELAARALPETFDYPAWSPDGKAIACTLINPAARQRVSVVEVRVADGACLPLGSRSWAYVLTPQWSSDGRSLFITALEDSAYSLWQLPYPRGDARRLTNDLTNYLRISLAARAQALVSVEISELTNLWLGPLGDTGRARQLIPGIGRYGLPVWTPDGKIVYASEANGSWGIWIMEADGSGRKQLTSTTYSGTNPSVSPNGRYIVFVLDQAGRRNIWRMDADGANLKQLTYGGDDFNPQCLPDGQWVVYNSFTSAKPYAVYKVPLNGGNAVLVTSAHCRAPAASPDGKLIACFYAGESVSAQVDPTSIAIIPTEDGDSVRKVCDFLSSMVVSDQTHLGWTPDGRAIIYVDNRGGHANLWSQPLDGGPAKQLTDFHGGQLFSFNLSHDGLQLVCLRGTPRQDVVLIRNFR